MENDLKNNKKSFIQIQNEWHRIQTLGIRDQLKAIRTLSHEVMEHYGKTEVTIEQMKLYIAIMKQAVRSISGPHKATKFLSKLIADWLALTGGDQATVLFKGFNKTSLQMTGPCIMIADPQHFKDSELGDTYSEKHYLQLINQGKCYIFDTGDHGVDNVHLRIIEASEPILTVKEFKCVVDSSEGAIIEIPTGTVAASELFHINCDEEHFISTGVIPGNYKICVYLFCIPKKVQSFYIVLCRTEEQANNQLSKIHQFSNPLDS